MSVPVGRTLRDDRGLAGSVISVAAAMITIAIVIQTGLYMLAREVAQGAAQHAADAARVENGTAAEAEAFARQFLDGNDLFDGSTVRVSRSEDTVTVTVTGTAWQIQPFIDPPITVRATAPVERVVE